MNVPDELRYTTDHEWAKTEGEHVRVGITDYAQEALGDIVFAQLPVVGSEVSAGGSLGELESSKSVSDIFAPFDGSVVEVNTELAQAPERINEDPYGEGWICVLSPASPSALDDLLSAADYRKLTEEA